MKRLLVGTTLAAVALFVWGFLYWGAMPVPWTIIAQVPDEVALQKTLREALPEPGAYYLPHHNASEGETYVSRAKAGPVATVLIHEGGDPNDVGVFLGGFVHMWLSALLMGLLLRRFAPASVGGAIAVAATAGLAAAVWSNLGRPMWYSQPWDYHLLFAVYDLTGWIVAGAVLGWFVRQR